MTVRTLWLLILNVPLVVMLRFEKPVAEKIWEERCWHGQVALNDCNWCSCGAKNQFICKARACNEVDMFGHFNDAIQNMDVGMNGHGVWRSEESACSPGVHYRKNDLLCVCTEDGLWPNPVCRDTFQVLHLVEATDSKVPESNTSCSATKLYLYDCNVCFCPDTGFINPKLCTNRQCTNDIVEKTHTQEDLVEEVYATCVPNKKYNIGCQTCTCLRNNRLLCDNCSAVVEKQKQSPCYQKEPGVIFKKDCNFCHCDGKGTIYCNAKNCLRDHRQITLPEMEFQLVEQSVDEYNCAPGTKYEKDCNVCHCFFFGGVKYSGCTQMVCGFSEQKHITTCIEGTTYKVNCLLCHCVVEANIKREYCTLDETCKLRQNSPEPLSSMHGYCEPLHFYQQDCNECRCLADGKTVACTTKICSKPKGKRTHKAWMKSKAVSKSRVVANEDNSLIIDFIPFVQKNNHCPKGQTYRVDCNICYCMESGNAVCTTKQC